MLGLLASSLAIDVFTGVLLSKGLGQLVAKASAVEPPMAVVSPSILHWLNP